MAPSNELFPQVLYMFQTNRGDFHAKTSSFRSSMVQWQSDGVVLETKAPTCKNNFDKVYFLLEERRAAANEILSEYATEVNSKYLGGMVPETCHVARTALAFFGCMFDSAREATCLAKSG